MRALTILQPWALCILDFGKMVENRTWRPPESLLGQRFAIHAGKVPDLPAYEGLLKDGYPLPLLSVHVSTGASLVSDSESAFHQLNKLVASAGVHGTEAVASLSRAPISPA